MFRVGEAFGQMNAFMKLGEHVALHLPSNLHLVDFFDAVTRMRKAICQLAVVRDENQPLGGEIEPPHTVRAWSIRRQQIGYAWPPGWVACRANDAHRLVDRKINRLGAGERFAIDSDLLCQRIDASAELGHDLSIDFYAPGENQFLAIASTSDAGLGQDFLQAVAVLQLFG